ncbi:hypothetical protein K470DRAFT_210455, partial [Piedraia hortae CBS 480.64]
SQQELTDFLLEPTTLGVFRTDEEFKTNLACAKHIYDFKHHIVFCHGDFACHNFMVQGGGITGFLDGECAGWNPQYLDYTTAMRARWNSWWSDLVAGIGGNDFKQEAVADRAVWLLTRDFYGY